MPTAKQRVEAAERRLFARYDLDVKTRYIELRDPYVEVRVLEVGSGPPVLFLHGAGEIASQWAPLLAHMDEVRAIAIDLPGFGLSEEVDYELVDPREYGVVVIKRLLDAYDLDHATIVANSLGGAWGLWFAHDSPDRLDRLALLGCPVFAVRGARISPALAATAIPGLNRFILNLPAPPLRVNRAMYRLILGKHAVETSPPEIVEVGHHAMDRMTFSTSMASLMERMVRFRRPRDEVVLGDDQLAEIKQPVLLIWGRHDHFGGPRIARRLERTLPDAHLFLLDAGHNPWLDEPEACARLIRRFMAA